MQFGRNVSIHLFFFLGALLSIVRSSVPPPTVPTIDLGRYLQGSSTEKAALVEEVRACCHEGGSFFYLINHGVDQALIDDVGKFACACAQALPGLP